MSNKSNWMFTAEEIRNSPSRLAGIHKEEEFLLRYHAAQMIQDIGDKLSVFQLCINTAIVYMHRFYMKQSFNKFKYNTMSAACLFLAAKVEEQPRKIEHVAKIVYNFLHKDQRVPDARSQEIQDMMEEISCDEQILLQTLGFCTIVEHPHTQIVTTCSLVRASKEISHSSYLFATTSLLLTTMCLQYPAPVIACVCINVACKWGGYEVPKSAEGRPWFKYVDQAMNIERLEMLSKELSAAMDKHPNKLFKRKNLGPFKAHNDNENRPKPIIGQPWSGAHLSGGSGSGSHQSSGKKPETITNTTTHTTTTTSTTAATTATTTTTHTITTHTSTSAVITTNTNSSIVATSVIKSSSSMNVANAVNRIYHKNIINTAATTTTTTTNSGSNASAVTTTTSTGGAVTSVVKSTSATHTNISSYNNNNNNNNNSNRVYHKNIFSNATTTTTTSTTGITNTMKRSYTDILPPSSSSVAAFSASNATDIKRLESSHRPFHHSNITDKNKEIIAPPTMITSTTATTFTNSGSNNSSSTAHAHRSPIKLKISNSSLSFSNSSNSFKHNGINFQQQQHQSTTLSNEPSTLQRPLPQQGQGHGFQQQPGHGHVGQQLQSHGVQQQQQLGHGHISQQQQHGHSIHQQQLGQGHGHIVQQQQQQGQGHIGQQHQQHHHHQDKEPIKIKLSLKNVGRVEEKRPSAMEESTQMMTMNTTTNGMKVVLSKSKDGKYIQQSQLLQTSQQQQQHQNQQPMASLSATMVLDRNNINNNADNVTPIDDQQQQHHHHNHHHHHHHHQHRKRKSSDHSANNSSSSSSVKKHSKPEKIARLDKHSEVLNQQPQAQQQQQQQYNNNNNINNYSFLSSIHPHHK